MEKITLVFDFEDKLSLSKLTRTFVEFNRMINLTSQLEDSLKDKLLSLDEFSDNEISVIAEQLKNKDTRLMRKRTQIEIQKISMNSPLELVVYSDITIHIAIILLGGKRRDFYHYTIPKGLLSYLYDFLKRLRN